MPGWTWINDEAERDEDASERLAPILDDLAAQHSQITAAEEQRGWQRQAEIEDGDEPYFDTDEEYEEYKTAQRRHSDLQQLRLEGIEVQLAHFGARMMRPYEHWNEDEQYMQYQESRYDY